MKAIFGHVNGRVQGVGFRAFVQEQAVALGVVGYVKNRPEGSVEFWIQGADATLQSLLEKIKTGPQFSRVDELCFDEMEPSHSYADFSIIF